MLPEADVALAAEQWKMEREYAATAEHQGRPKDTAGHGDESASEGHKGHEQLTEEGMEEAQDAATKYVVVKTDSAASLSTVADMLEESGEGSSTGLSYKAQHACNPHKCVPFTWHSHTQSAPSRYSTHVAVSPGIQVIHWGIGDVTQNDIVMARVASSTVRHPLRRCEK